MLAPEVASGNTQTHRTKDEGTKGAAAQLAVHAKVGEM